MPATLLLIRTIFHDQAALVSSHQIRAESQASSNISTSQIGSFHMSRSLIQNPNGDIFNARNGIIFLFDSYGDLHFLSRLHPPLKHFESSSPICLGGLHEKYAKVPNVPETESRYRVFHGSTALAQIARDGLPLE